MKRIIITGASSGLGYDLACMWASQGHLVGAVARRSDRLEQLESLYPGNIVTATIDITAQDAPERIEELIGRMGGLDIMVQGAGMGKQNPSLDYSVERNTILTNCLGFTAVISTAFNHFASHPTPGATIAAITSVARTKGLGMAAAYSATKRYGSTYLDAIEQLAHLRKVDVAIVDVRPGFIATDLLDDANRYPMLMSRPYAVGRIARAIMHRRRVATVDWRWRLLVALWRMIPRALWKRFPARTRRNDAR